jgi:hypothetical protein
MSKGLKPLFSVVGPPGEVLRSRIYGEPGSEKRRRNIWQESIFSVALSLAIFTLMLLIMQVLLWGPIYYCPYPTSWDYPVWERIVPLALPLIHQRRMFLGESPYGAIQ